MIRKFKIGTYYRSLTNEQKTLFRGLIFNEFGNMIKSSTIMVWFQRDQTPLHAIPRVLAIIENPDYNFPQLEVKEEVA